MTVDDFENMSNLAVLYWDTHSGMGELRPDAGPAQPDGGPPVDFAFMTSTVATAALGQTTYKSLRDNGYLALAGATMPSGPEPRYAITQKYIRDRLKGKFTVPSLVAIDSCTGAAADAAWDAAGVSHYLGWSAVSGNLSTVAFERFFDRLAGGNVTDPYSFPHERPFPAKTAVERWMQANGYDLDRSVFSDGTASIAQLKFLDHPAHGDFAILRPTIYRLLNTAPAAGQGFYRWTLDGTYGDDPGLANRSISLGNTPLDVLQWDSQFVIVKVPSPIPSGAVQVAIGPRKSNAVRVTEWTIPFTYAFVGKETLQYTLKATCRLRADVRGFRNQPRDPLGWPPIPTWTLEDTNGSLTASGALHDTLGNLVEAWSGGGQLRWLDPARLDPQHSVLCQGNFDHASSTLAIFVVAATGTFTKTDKDGKTTVGSATVAGIPIPMSLSIDWPTMRINGNTLNANPNQLGNNGVSATLQWPSVLPVNPPTEDDGR
jgi:hypothetical protein